MLDMVDIPFWSGEGPYPSVKVRLDFRGADIGDFVYHCHILEHEDIMDGDYSRSSPARFGCDTERRSSGAEAHSTSGPPGKTFRG